MTWYKKCKLYDGATSGLAERKHNSLDTGVILVIIFQLKLSYSFDFLVTVILLVNYRGIF